jgi:uncharacterized membrane protein
VPKKSDGLTLYFILSVALVNCLTVLVVWYEIFLSPARSWPETATAIGQGVGASLAVTLMIFANVEVAMLLSERYRMKRFNEGKQEGKQEERNRIREILKQSNVILDPNIEDSLFGASENHPDQGR